MGNTVYVCIRRSGIRGLPMGVYHLLAQDKVGRHFEITSVLLEHLLENGGADLSLKPLATGG